MKHEIVTYGYHIFKKCDYASDPKNEITVTSHSILLLVWIEKLFDAEVFSFFT